MEGKYWVNAFGIAIALLVYLLGSLFYAGPAQIMFLVSSFGILALATLILVLLTPLLVRVKNVPLTRFLFTQQRWIGLYVFFFALVHVLLVYNFFFNWNFGIIFTLPNSVFLVFGLLAFLTLAVISSTSNDFAIRALGSRNWKNVQRLVYLVLVLVLLHSFNVGLLVLNNQLLQAVIVIALLVLGALKFNVIKL